MFELTRPGHGVSSAIAIDVDGVTGGTELDAERETWALASLARDDATFTDVRTFVEGSLSAPDVLVEAQWASADAHGGVAVWWSTASTWVNPPSP